MGWLDISQILNDFQIQPNQLVYLAGGEVKKNNENYACVYSDELTPRLKALNLESAKLTGYREVLVNGAIDIEKVLSTLKMDNASFNKIEVNPPIMGQTSTGRKRTIFTNPQRLSVFFYDMWSQNNDIWKSQ